MRLRSRVIVEATGKSIFMAVIKQARMAPISAFDVDYLAYLPHNPNRIYCYLEVDLFLGKILFITTI